MTNRKMFFVAMVFAAFGAVPSAQPTQEFSAPMMPEGMACEMRCDYAKAELFSIVEELGTRSFGELSLAGLKPYWDRLGTAIQKDSYIQRATTLSLIFPGAGQFKNGETAAGLGFLGLHTSVVAGILVGTYFMLPADLRFDRMDYLSSPIESIRTAWRSHSIGDYLPAMGIMTLGALVDSGIRIWSSVNARDGAKALVESGNVQFEPVVFPGCFGMKMKF